MTQETLDEIKDAFEQLLSDFDDFKRILRSVVPRHEWDRLKAYGIGYVEAGLVEGVAMPCPEPLNKFIESLEADPEEDSED